MQFYEYNHTGKYPLINEVNSPLDVHTEDPIVFLIYAPNRDVARAVADMHVFGGMPIVPFYGLYKSEKYEGDFLCAM